MPNITSEILTGGVEKQNPWVTPIQRPVPGFTDIYLFEFFRSIRQITPELRDPSNDVLHECGSESEFNSLVDDLLMTRIVEHARPYEKPNAGWQSHRRVTPSRLTGFEPYFIGTNWNPDRIANHISTFFDGFIDAYRAGHHDYNTPDIFWQMKALLRGQILPQRRGGVLVRSIGMMDYILHTMTSDYRKMMSDDGKAHRAEMQRRLSGIQQYSYVGNGDNSFDVEAHSIVKVPLKPELSPPSGASFRDEQDIDNPYIFVKRFLGQFGDPLIRGIQGTWRNTMELGIPTTARETAKLLETREKWSKVPTIPQR